MWISLFPQVCRHHLAPHLSQVSLDKTLLDPPEGSQPPRVTVDRPLPSPMPPPSTPESNQGQIPDKAPSTPKSDHGMTFRLCILKVRLIPRCKITGYFYFSLVQSLNLKPAGYFFLWRNWTQQDYKMGCTWHSTQALPRHFLLSECHVVCVVHM